MEPVAIGLVTFGSILCFYRGMDPVRFGIWALVRVRASLICGGEVARRAVENWKRFWPECLEKAMREAGR